MSTDGELTYRPAIQPFIEKLRILVVLPDFHFAKLHVSPLTRYLALTQHCPEENVERHIRTLLIGLKRRRVLLLPSYATQEAINHKRSMWTRVVFILLLMLKKLADQIYGYAVIYKKQEEKDSETRRLYAFQTVG